jgi:hypothetical protein
VLFAFPSRYWFTIGRQRVFSLGEWSPQIPTRLHVSRGTQDAASSPVHFPLRGSHTLWLRFPADSRNVRFGNSTYAVLQPPNASTWVWAVPISLAATFGISVIYFPPGTEMVHFPGLAHTRLCIQRAVTRVHLAGFPHSEILGSKPACGSPRLIAACHVLLRLLAPRHPPYALSSLIIKLTQSVFTIHLPINPSTFRFTQLHTSSCRFSFQPSQVSPIRNTGFRFYAPRTIDKSAFSSTVMLNSSKTCNRPQ